MEPRYEIELKVRKKSKRIERVWIEDLGWVEPEHGPYGVKLKRGRYKITIEKIQD